MATPVSQLIDEFIDDLISDGYEIVDVIAALERKLAGSRKKIPTNAELAVEAIAAARRPWCGVAAQSPSSTTSASM